MPTLIPFAVPVLRPEPPSGDAWLHEVKLDGWRMQAHKAGREVALLSRKGTDLTGRFRVVADAVRRLRTRDVVLDGEVVALDAAGRPDFQALLRLDAHVVLYAFDVLAQGDRDLRPLALVERRERLEKVLVGAGEALRLSEAFDDPVALLAELEVIGVEGIVSKRRDAPYPAGTRSGWVKVKTASWRAAHADRGEWFGRR